MNFRAADLKERPESKLIYNFCIKPPWTEKNMADGV